jgi:hypothetical protein
MLFVYSALVLQKRPLTPCAAGFAARAVHDLQMAPREHVRPHMTPALLAHVKETFNAFRLESIWLRTVHHSATVLFSSDPEVEAVLRRTAGAFFTDLNHILIEYWILIVCRITDPAQTSRRDNLTVKQLLKQLEQLGALTVDIESAATELQKYRDVLNDARNRAVSHADKDTFLNPKLLGAHSAADVQSFLLHLQLFNDLVGEALGEGPLDFSSAASAGDALDLLQVLKSAA